MGKPAIRTPDLVVPRSVITRLRGTLTGIETVMLVEAKVFKSEEDKTRHAAAHDRIAQLRHELDRFFADPTPSPLEQVTIISDVLERTQGLIARAYREEETP